MNETAQGLKVETESISQIQRNPEMKNLGT